MTAGVEGRSLGGAGIGAGGGPEIAKSEILVTVLGDDEALAADPSAAGLDMAAAALMAGDGLGDGIARPSRPSFAQGASLDLGVWGFGFLLFGTRKGLADRAGLLITPGGGRGRGAAGPLLAGVGVAGGGEDTASLTASVSSLTGERRAGGEGTNESGESCTGGDECTAEAGESTKGGDERVNDVGESSKDGDDEPGSEGDWKALAGGEENGLGGEGRVGEKS